MKTSSFFREISKTMQAHSLIPFKLAYPFATNKSTSFSVSWPGTLLGLPFALCFFTGASAGVSTGEWRGVGSTEVGSPFFSMFYWEIMLPGGELCLNLSQLLEEFQLSILSVAATNISGLCCEVANKNIAGAQPIADISRSR